ncbi:MAG TPA: hypothetical protein VK519_16085, partial [Pinirhizobacter sp.]|uniref:hypothetical protein n=1 Tax=Pinirhizobacter sp. TaxID=2950432 RepID=UPI002BA2176B
MAIDAIPPQRHVAHFPDTSPQWLPGPTCCHRLGHLEATTARIDAEVTHLRADVNHLRVDVNQLKVDVNQLKVDVTELKIDMAAVKERLTHMPTKAQLLVWGLGAAAVIIAAQW